MTRDAQQTAVYNSARPLLGRDRAAPPVIRGARGRALDWCVILGHASGHEPITPQAA